MNTNTAEPRRRAVCEVRGTEKGWIVRSRVLAPTHVAPVGVVSRHSHTSSLNSGAGSARFSEIQIRRVLGRYRPVSLKAARGGFWQRACQPTPRVFSCRAHPVVRGTHPVSAMPCYPQVPPADAGCALLEAVE